ncbi:MAG: ATP-binding protein [Opitutaceae bacterium]|nr:ATP-binding protein [Opitutaceae bacterium]
MSAPADTTPPAPTSAAVDRENPWPGLGSYDESMHAFFFGRDAESEELLRLVRRDPVALFYGQSGLGKSSLLQAGLFPRLRAVDLMPVHIRLRFGAGFPHPVAQILDEVAAAARRAGGEAPAAPSGTTLFEYFYDEAHEFWSARNRVLTPVIVFDQFEEVFTLGARDAAALAQRDEILAQLGDLAARRAPDSLVARFEHDPALASRYSVDRTRCRLLFSLREDFLPELGSLREHLPTLPSGGLRLQRLRGHQAREVLEKPGAHLLEPETAERIIRFVAAERTAGAAHELTELEVEPALLNVVARELNNRRRVRGLDRISADLVQGARDEILVDFYERAFTGLEPHVREFVEDQLLTTTGFRDSVAVEDAEASYRVSRDSLAVLVDRRLLRIDERFDMQRVELTHDLLAGVVKASRDSRREREAAAAERRRADEAKRAAEQAAAEAQAKLRHTRMRALIGTAMAVLAVGIGGLLYLNQRKAEEARRLDAERQAAVQARQEASDSLARANEEVANSLLLRADAALTTGGFDTARLLMRMGQDHGIFPEETLAWFAAALSQPRVLSLEAYVRLDQPVVQAEFAPRGRLVAVTSAGTVRLASLAAGTPGSVALEAPPGELGAIRDATCIDLLWDERPQVAVGTRTREVRLFDLESGALVRVLRAPPRTAADAATSASGSGAKSDTSTSAAVETRPEDDRIERARFDTTGRVLAAIAADGVLAVWRLGDHTQWPDALAPDGDGAALEVFTTRIERTATTPSDPKATAISWAMDGSLILTTATGTQWFARPSPQWGTEKPIERFTAEGLRGAIRVAPDGRSSEWFVANPQENRLYWLGLPPHAQPESSASELRSSEALPDTVHSIAVMSGADVVFAALRNGTIAVCQSDSTTSRPSIKVLQTTPASRARQLALRLRPDGRFLAAVSDEGTVALYRVSVPTPLDATPLPASGIMRDGDSWLLGLMDGTFVRTDGSKAGTWPTQVPDGAQARAGQVPSVDKAEETLLFYTENREADAGALRCGVVRSATGEVLWSRLAKELGPLAESALSTAAMSPDLSTLALPAQDGTILLFDARSGAAAGAPLAFAGEVQNMTWSGDSRRLAAANTIQEIAIFEPAADIRPVVTLHARQSRINGFTLDGPGHTLAYVTADARLVLERLAPGQRRASLAVPLDGPAGSVGIAAGRAGQSPSIALFIQHKLRIVTGTLPPSAELGWANLAAVQGYETGPLPPNATTTDRLSAAWADDAVSVAAAALMRDTAAWIAKAEAQFAAGGERLGPELFEQLRTEGAALRARFDELAAHQAAFAAFRDRLARATADLVAFSDELAPGLTRLQRWPIVLYQQTLAPDSDIATTYAAEKALPALVELLGKRTDASPALDRSDVGLYQGIVRLAALSGRADSTLIDARSSLRQALFSPEEWVKLIAAAPNAYLIDREANAQAGENAMDASNELYAELERREPASLTYPIRRGNNLRRMGRRDEAMPLFEHAIAAAAAAGDGEIEAEARVYRAWTYQEMDGRMQDAHADMVAAARLAPRDAWTLRNAVQFLLSDDAAGDAVDAAAGLVAADDSAASRLLQARVYLALGDGVAARAAVEPLSDSDDVSARLDIVEAFGADPAYGNRAFAAEWAYLAYQATSDRALEERALRQLGPLWLQVDDLIRSRNALDKLLSYGLSIEEQAVVRALQGRIDMRRRDLARARDSYEASLRLDPGPTARIRRDHAHFLEWSGETSRALAEYAAAAAGDATEAWIHVRALQRLDSPDAARRALDAALERFPEDRTLRLERTRYLLATDPGQAVDDLSSLDDGSLDPVALQAAALQGRAAEAARRNLARLADAYAGDHVDQAALHALAFGQTQDATQRLAALREISTAIDLGYRGDVPLRVVAGFEALAGDPVFALADACLAAEDGSRESLFALARFNIRAAALISHQETKSALLARAGAAARRGVALEVFTPADVLADPELAPLAAQF